MQVMVCHVVWQSLKVVFKLTPNIAMLIGNGPGLGSGMRMALPIDRTVSGGGLDLNVIMVAVDILHAPMPQGCGVVVGDL